MHAAAATLALALAAAAPRTAQEPAAAREVAPAPLVEYMGRPVAPTMHWSGAEWLLRATRESEEHTSRLLEALAVRPGDTVCDLGCGAGYLSLPLAERVGEAGLVIAVDIQPEMLRQLEERAQAAGARNIRPVLGEPADPKLEPGSCDLVLLVDVYHELGHPEQVLAAVERSLAPGGRLVLVEFRAEDPDIPIQPEHKMARAQVERELAANGWRLASSFDELPWQHVLTFVPAEAPAQDGGGGGFFDSLGEEVRDGAWLYERHCSGCHGPTGAGDGETAKQLGVAPRDFNAGGFSFGNTRESLFRTLGSGIPGRSVMPSFAGTLSEEERWLVVDHVRTLMPPQGEEDARASVLEVRERPVLARGKLPPIAEGLPEHARGLLIGLPSGLTFECDLEDMKLLCVRLGDFADREDWRDRGGGYLRPLGRPILDLPWDKSIFFPWREWHASGSFRSVRTRLRSTSVREHRVALEYGLSIGDSAVAEVAEELRVVPTASGPAFARRFTARGEEHARPLLTYPLGSAHWDRCRVLVSPGDWRCFVAEREGSGSVLVAVRGDVEVENLGWTWRIGMPVFPSEEDTDPSGPLVVLVLLKQGQTEVWDVVALPVAAESVERLEQLALELTR